MIRFAYFRGFIVTANEDGSIPITAKTVCRIPTEDCNQQLLAILLARANSFVPGPDDPEVVVVAEEVLNRPVAVD